MVPAIQLLLELGATLDTTNLTTSAATPSGTYTALTFRTTSSGITTDQLATSSSLRITMTANGTTTGRLLVPGGAEDGGDLDADMAGTWTLMGSTVRFVQTADTFVRDILFTASPNQLVGDAVFDGTRIELTLTK